MNDKTILRVFIEPATTHERSDQFILIAAVVDEERNVFVRQLAYIATRSFARSEMPEQFEYPACFVEVKIERAAKAAHLRVGRRFAFHFTHLHFPASARLEWCYDERIPLKVTLLSQGVVKSRQSSLAALLF